MTGRGTYLDDDGSSGDELVAWYRKRRARDMELTARQLAALQAVDDARREGLLVDGRAAELEAMVRAGQVAGARKRLTEARRAAR